jgi:hypothetical protein
MYINVKKSHILDLSLQKSTVLLHWFLVDKINFDSQVHSIFLNIDEHLQRKISKIICEYFDVWRG